MLAFSFVFADTFTVEGKEINLIDFEGYKRGDTSVLADEFKSINGMILYDLLIPNDANCPSFDPETLKYNDFFVVCVQPEMLKGTDFDQEFFSDLRKSMSESFVSEGFEYSADKLNQEYANKLIIKLEDVTEPRIFINEEDCIGFSSASKYEGFDQNILNFSAITLIKGKIIWLCYYSAYNSVLDYEKSVTRFTKFIRQYINANTDEKVLSEKEQFAQDYALLVSNDLESNMKTILSEGYSKAYGLKYSFFIPESFSEKASKKPHIVHSFFKTYGEYLVNVSVLVDDSTSALINLMEEQYLIEGYKDEIISQYFPKNGNLLNSGKTTISGRRDAFFLEFFTEQTVLDGINIKLYSYQIFFLYDGILTALNFSLGGINDEFFDTLIDVFKPLFLFISSTFSCHENDSTIKSEASKEFGVEINNAIVRYFAISILLPVVLGIIIGLIIRYLVVRRPISKNMAAMVSIFIGLIMITITYIEFGDITAVGVIFGVFLCHFIMRIGHAEYDAEIQQVEMQKIEAEQRYDEASEMFQKAEAKYNMAQEEQEKAHRSWEEAQKAKAEAESDKRKAQSSFSEIEKLKDELRKVKERNKKLEDEAQSRSNQSSQNIVKDRKYYEAVLGVIAPYSKSDLRKAYLQKSMFYHPDRVNSLGPKLKTLAEEEMREINVAYDKLQAYCEGIL